jgi:hypothetical protein
LRQSNIGSVAPVLVLEGERRQKMDLTPITQKAEGKRAYYALKTCLTKGAGVTTFRRTIGWRPDHTGALLHWHEPPGFWVRCRLIRGSRYGCTFGTVNPKFQYGSLHQICQINPSIKGIGRSCGGVLLRDANSHVYLAHTGGIAGGTRGIGKKAFLEHYDRKLTPIVWPGGKEERVVVLGRVGSKSFCGRLYRYIRAVEDFKTKTKSRT